jgi:hypothetical protein
MRPVIVVVSRVFGQDVAQVPLAEDEHPIGAFASGGSDPAFSMGVCPRRLRRGADDLDAGRGEDRIELRGEIR